MAESKSTCSAFPFNGHFEKTEEFAPFPINSLAPMSECVVRASRPGGASYSIGGTVGPPHRWAVRDGDMDVFG